MVFHSGSNYDNHFIIKEVAEGFEGEFYCLGENAEKWETLFDPITKKLKE